jgi:hypothetical protein
VSVLVLIGLALIACGVLLLAVVLVLRLRAARPASQPRTVADLVRLREESGASLGDPVAGQATTTSTTSTTFTAPLAAAASAPAGADAFTAPAPAAPATAGDAVERPAAALGVTAANTSTAARRDGAAAPGAAPRSSPPPVPPPVPVDTAPVVGEPATPDPAQPSADPTPAAPLPLNLDGDDVPWRRGAWMAAGLSGGQPWREHAPVEPVPVMPAPVEPVPLRIVPSAARREPVAGIVEPVGAPAAEAPAPEEPAGPNQVRAVRAAGAAQPAAVAEPAAAASTDGEDEVGAGPGGAVAEPAPGGAGPTGAAPTAPTPAAPTPGGPSDRGPGPAHTENVSHAAAPAAVDPPRPIDSDRPTSSARSQESTPSAAGENTGTAPQQPPGGSVDARHGSAPEDPTAGPGAGIADPAGDGDRMPERLPEGVPPVVPLLGAGWDEPQHEDVPASAVPERFAEPVPVVGTVPVVGAVPGEERAGEPPMDHAAPATGRAARRSRPTPDERAAEQAAADLALLRTFGFAEPGIGPDAAPVVAMAGSEDDAAHTPDGAAQPVRFRAVHRDGSVVGGAAVTLLDDRGGDVAGGKADADGRGEVLAPAPGSYVLVLTAAGHQPGAAAITVASAPTAVDVLLARSASVSGSVRGEDGPIAGARVTLVQDGEVVDAVDTADDGAYRIEDIGAGEYGLSVAAAGCRPAAVGLEVAEEADVHHDVDLVPVTPVTDSDDGTMTGDAISG